MLHTNFALLEESTPNCESYMPQTVCAVSMCPRKNTLWWFLMQRRENELYIPYRVTHVTYEISFLVEMIINCHAFIFVVSGIKVCHASGWDP